MNWGELSSTLPCASQDLVCVCVCVCSIMFDTTLCIPPGSCVFMCVCVCVCVCVNGVVCMCVYVCKGRVGIEDTTEVAIETYTYTHIHLSLIHI